MVKRWIAALLWAALAMLLGTLLLGPDHWPLGAPWQMIHGSLVFELVGVGMALRSWRHPGLDRRTRRAWGIIGVALILLTVSDVLRGVFATAGFPNPADLARLSFGPVLLAGLLSLPMKVRGKRAQHKLWLDTAVVVLGSGMLLWYVEVGSAVSAAGQIPGNVLAAAIAYPGLDLVMIFGAAVVLLRGAAGSARRPAIMITVAMLAIVIGDIYLGYQHSHGGDGRPNQWQFACWLTGHALLGMAAFTQVQTAGEHTLTIEDPTARGAARMPYLAMGLGYLLLMFAMRGYQVRTVGLVLGAVAMTSVVVARQIVALRENHELATTDTLTGLVNRRRLYESLRYGLARSSRNGHGLAAVLIDMNGFKQVNDTMGHEAGDQLLVAFGAVLRRTVFGTDVVGRLGGDEFAVVLHNIDAPENAEAVVKRILAAMAEPVMIGDAAVQPRASFGIAVAAPGEDADALLRRADAAMYRAKEEKSTMYAVDDSRAPVALAVDL